jgi:parallel beta-helix repeat protein
MEIRGTKVSFVIVVVIALATSMLPGVSAATVPVPYDGPLVTWDEYSWGDVSGQVVDNSLLVVGTYDGSDTVPNSGGWNGYDVIAREILSGDVTFITNITYESAVGTEFSAGIGISGPTQPDTTTNSLFWGSYLYSSSGANSIGWRQDSYGGVIDRLTVNASDIVIGQKVEYKLALGGGFVSYFIDGLWQRTEQCPLSSCQVSLHVGWKYDGTSVSVRFNDIRLSQDPVPAPPYVSRGPIDINGNAGFTTQNGVIAGSGTPSDPYVIGGWEIADSYLAIRISNTDAWFVIRDVFVHGGIGGIYFYTVENAMIYNARMEGFVHAGIAVWSSKNVFITQSSSSNNGHEGIVFTDSASLNITENRVSGNLWQGIMLDRCTRSWVIDNAIEGNVLEKDSAGYPYQAGIVLFSCSGIATYQNTIVQDALVGAYDDAPGSNVWDRGYPMGGNYWSANAGADVLCGPLQNILGSDQLGDAPYDVQGGAKDNYPIMLMLTENTAPAAPFSTYMVGGGGEVMLGVDASFCRDNQDPPEALLIRWDWQDDGIWDTGFSSTKVAVYHYPASGTHTIRLQVLDTDGSSGESIRSQYVDVDHPIVDAGPNQVVFAGDVVVFDGSGSYDESGIRSYEWTFFDGTARVLEGVGPIYIFDSAGVYRVNLVVTDMFGNAANGSMIVTVWGQPITLVKNNGPPKSSSVQWSLEPNDYGLWNLRIENFKLKSVTIDVYDTTGGFQVSVYHIRLRFSSYDADPYGVVTTGPVIVAKGHVYTIVVAPLGPTGSYALMNEQFTNQV